MWFPPWKERLQRVFSRGSRLLLFSELRRRICLDPPTCNPASILTVKPARKLGCEKWTRTQTPVKGLGGRTDADRSQNYPHRNIQTASLRMPHGLSGQGERFREVS